MWIKTSKQLPDQSQVVIAKTRHHSRATGDIDWTFSRCIFQNGRFICGNEVIHSVKYWKVPSETLV